MRGACAATLSSPPAVLRVATELEPDHAPADALTTAPPCVQEQTFHNKYVELYKEHVMLEAWGHASAQALPPIVKDIASAAELLAKPPNIQTHVFCVATRACDPIVLSSGRVVDQLARGEVAMLPYAPLRPLLANGDVQLC